MKRTIVCGLIAATAVAAPAAVDAKSKPDKAVSPYKCLPKKVGYTARGVLVSESLEQTAGADTERRGDDRYSGEVVVDVKRVNHKRASGEETYTVENARVRVRPRDSEPAAGARIKVSGKLTKVARKCENAEEPTITIRKVDIKAAPQS